MVQIECFKPGFIEGRVVNAEQIARKTQGAQRYALTET
jgi:hypothetical protein